MTFQELFSENYFTSALFDRRICFMRIKDMFLFTASLPSLYFFSSLQIS